ncbi:MAG: 23S rRNA (guanosine(2251)-2'-O)-methyltransferase RlmB [Chloroflexi bacterium]|nr:23S rRNA (guanosine(2251)-2'-O)-methyltransferase RlmB [Chloroflexota bacterium]
MPEFLYGHWAVIEAMRAGRRKLDALMIHERAEKRGAVGDAMSMAEELNLPIQRVQRRILDDLATNGNHQGLVLRVGPYPYCDVEEILGTAARRNEAPFILLLDLLKDPQNVGSLIRVSDAVGAHGIVIQERRSVAVTPAVVNASSGAVEHINVAQVTNLVSAMKELKDQDVWMVGLDVGHNIPPLDKTDLNMALGLVMGSEGEGLRRLVRDTCDLLLTLPMRGQVGSLNVATAGAIALYSAWSARGWNGWVHA